EGESLSAGIAVVAVDRINPERRRGNDREKLARQAFKIRIEWSLRMCVPICRGNSGCAVGDRDDINRREPRVRAWDCLRAGRRGDPGLQLNDKDTLPNRVL